MKRIVYLFVALLMMATAAVFGGGRHIWRLQLHFNLSKVEGRWYFTSARASKY